jgi:hypothetical protein
MPRAGHGRSPLPVSFVTGAGQGTPTGRIALEPVGSSYDMRLVSSVAILLICLSVAGCGVVAAPCRVASAGLKMVPLVGHAAAAPTDACADVIDP